MVLKIEGEIMEEKWSEGSATKWRTVTKWKRNNEPFIFSIGNKKFDALLFTAPMKRVVGVCGVGRNLYSLKYDFQ